MSHPLANRITNMVVDEAHCILSWGASEFRPAYKKLGMLRAVVPNVKVLALTATATLKGQEEIISSLHMHDTKVISASPDRTNVFLEVKRDPFKWVMKQLLWKRWQLLKKQETPNQNVNACRKLAASLRQACDRLFNG
ncbi:uncharacterized protein LOC123560344 [Mercenaria mercenaria]|uniref:uncharacterized protein LOC123560344 n=1 Tax=Mercenaria mercenaria TaxID=6596 RepID=UPI00234F0349|nr:uncharacterized protein LOC123560344 [Mercenaria mercenaria]